MDYDLKSLGRRIFQARKRYEAERGRTLSQNELGEALGVTGVAVGSWENGNKPPSLAAVWRLAEELEVAPGWLAFGDVAAEVPKKRERPRMQTRSRSVVQAERAAEEKRRRGEGA